MEAGDLNESDEKILNALQEGRATPAYLADATGLANQTIHNRLNILVAAGHVAKIHDSGLYELVSDPRETQ